MKHLYQQTFDQVRLSEDNVRAMRETLTSCCAEPKTEELKMKRETNRTRPILRRSGTMLAAIVMICALTISAFAYGGTRIYQMLTGGSFEMGENEQGSYVCGELDTANLIPPVELREDGRLYLTINGENKDITEECSYTEPYIYEFVAEDGLRHAFIIGGDLDAIGWGEFIFDENNMPTGGTMSFGTPDGSDDAPWFAAGKQELGLPW